MIAISRRCFACKGEVETVEEDKEVEEQEEKGEEEKEEQKTRKLPNQMKTNYEVLPLPSHVVDLIHHGDGAP